MSGKRNGAWRNRIVGSGEEAPDELTANPKNWRTHPRHQQDALEGVLDQVGWVQEVIVNKRTGHLIDGHLRVSLAKQRREKSLPVLYVDLSEQEEALILSTLDPLAGLATADAQKLDELLQGVEVSDAALRELLSDLSAQANALLASANADQLSDGAKDAIKKGAGDERAAKVDLIFTLGAGGQSYVETRNGTSAQVLCCLACKSGWLYGLRSSAGPCAVADIMLSHKVQFVDCLYTDYNHDLHLAQVAKHRPRYATVRDIMLRGQCEQAGIKYYAFDQIMKWAEELREYADNVIVIPKTDCIKDIPPEYVLGLSIPTSHGGTPLPLDKFRGRRVHLLGGSPNRQISYWQALRDEVISMDNNYLMKIAQYGVAWIPEGRQVSLTDLGFGAVSNPLYVALAISLGNFGAYFRKAPPIQLDGNEAELFSAYLRDGGTTVTMVTMPMTTTRTKKE
jgi:hypothetical protein